MEQYQLQISIKVRYLPEESNPNNRQFAFAYTVNIHNVGQIPSQLIGRHWIITDTDGAIQEIKGLGIVGHQPLLKPGEKLEYTSWMTISTPTGSMKGEFFCVTEDVQFFQAPVDELSITIPNTVH